MSHRTILLGTLLLSFNSYSYAESMYETFTGTELGVFVSDFTYEETVDGAFFMDDKSTMYGFYGSVADVKNDAVLKAEASYQKGEMEYTSNGTGTMNGHEDYIFDLRATMGWPEYLIADIYIMPYFGLGYQYLNDDAEGMISSTGASGYLREQSYLYSPIGFEIKGLQMDENWYIGFKFEYDLFLFGKNTTTISEQSLEFEQEDGMGLRASVPLSINLFTIEPYIKYWSIERSSSLFGVDKDGNSIEMYEPENTTTEFGVKFSMYL